MIDKIFCLVCIQLILCRNIGVTDIYGALSDLLKSLTRATGINRQRNIRIFLTEKISSLIDKWF